MIRKNKNKIIKDMFQAYLIDGAQLTKPDGFPVIEENIVSNIIPKELVQWDRRSDIKDYQNTGICFYCNDEGFSGVLNHPNRTCYIDLLKRVAVVIGLDASPYDDMPLVVQKYQIFRNLAITYYYGKLGIKIIPNVRLGSNYTFSSLEAYPKHTLIAIGTNGFMKNKDNRYLYTIQFKRIVEELEPSGILIYGPVYKEINDIAIDKGIKIYPYDSYTMKQNKIDKQKEDGIL